MMRLWGLCGLLALGAVVMMPQEARAGDIRVAIGSGGAGTEWRGDAAFVTQLKLGYRFLGIFGLYGDMHLGYAGVDQRVLTLFSLGIQVWGKLGITRPYARVSILHQHEESLSVVAGDFGRAILGLGEGIRHRGGVGFALGMDIPLYQRKKLQLFMSVEAMLKWFPGDMGPAVYMGGNLGFGMNYSI